MTDEAQAAESVPQPGDMPADAAATVDAQVVTALEAEIAELKDKVLRTLADMENLRRRTEKEVRDGREYAITGFARDLLSVSDNLARAVSTIAPEAREQADDTIKSLLEGVDLTSRELEKTLEKHGVRKLEPMGTRFDPNVHQAMFELPNPDVPNGTVVQVLQDGYVIGERVLRPALVGVAKGGPKPAGVVDKTV